MAKVSFAPHESLLADVSPHRRSVLFPVLEFIVITGLVWLGIGLIDAYFDKVAVAHFGVAYTPPSLVAKLLPHDQTLMVLTWLRRLLLIAWAWLAWTRCIRHLIFRSRTRMVLTDRRLITASGHVRSEICEVPLEHIVDARHRGSDVAVYTIGARLPLVLHNVPQAKKFARLLRKQIRPL
ncbi:hypothetical protein [Corynebacterium anserum]|uniref:Uncharacterized protein n=1 Tax=Corynebacterium anserum TaxID=2684406 RepID=A0A7G7YPR6_9CORY|nr:hypothetical protein [Corynebacterium anserum]MBC2682129.1 hypothetical protein [Corynebacterium anserum]QNH96486.1 hypothetical protein GP473_07300 [Corynebacterium anserum]